MKPLELAPPTGGAWQLCSRQHFSPSLKHSASAWEATHRKVWPVDSTLGNQCVTVIWACVSRTPGHTRLNTWPLLSFNMSRIMVLLIWKWKFLDYFQKQVQPGDELIQLTSSPENVWKHTSAAFTFPRKSSCYLGAKDAQEADIFFSTPDVSVQLRNFDHLPWSWRLLLLALLKQGSGQPILYDR